MMKNKINIAELLKDCPKGMELDCTIWDNVVFDHIDTKSDYPIYIKKMSGELECLTEDGHFNFNLGAKCVIFPKGKTTWEGFIPPYEFKEGDVVVSVFDDIHILRTEDSSYCAYRVHWTELSKLDNTITTGVKVARLATEEEKAKLFDAIKSNGYKWDEETKTLKKLPKFKVGDKIIKKNGLNVPFVITGVSDVYYWSGTENSVEVLPVADQNDWELVPNKFDITTLKPFDKVLVRHNKDNKWCGSFFSHIDKDLHSNCYKFVTIAGKSYPMMIPYEGNEYLLGKTDDCTEYYKTWKE